LVSLNIAKCKDDIISIFNGIFKTKLETETCILTLDEVIGLGPNLLTFMHLVYGSTARSTGLTSIKWFNCQDRRNIFLDGNVICIAVKSMKTFRKTGKNHIYRFQPKTVSNLLYHYVLIRHVIHVKATSLNLFNATALSAQPYLLSVNFVTLLTKFQEIMEETIGFPIMFGEFRQFMSLALRLTVMDDTMTAMNATIANQAGRSVATDTLNYGLTSQYLPKTSTVTTYQNKRLSQMWQVKLGLD
jgi:hypothetical protein